MQFIILLKRIIIINWLRKRIILRVKLLPWKHKTDFGQDPFIQSSVRVLPLFTFLSNFSQDWKPLLSRYCRPKYQISLRPMVLATLDTENADPAIRVTFWYIIAIGQIWALKNHSLISHLTNAVWSGISLFGTLQSQPDRSLNHSLIGNLTITVRS